MHRFRLFVLALPQQHRSKVANANKRVLSALLQAPSSLLLELAGTLLLPLYTCPTLTTLT